MAVIRFVERYPLPVAVVFAFFRRPANVVAVAPEGLDLRLVEGPQEPSAGAVFAVQVRRWGLSRRIETQVVMLEEPSLLVERQVSGPFREWVLERRFVPIDGGTELTETITYEPPGGMLGLMMTPSAVESELARAYQGRAERVMARLGAAEGG
jgi:ligand-binding SRPBCC domain-containing protein